MGKQVLCLRNPWPADSAFMGKMYATTFFLWIFLVPLFFLNRASHEAGIVESNIKIELISAALGIIFLPPLFLFLPLILYRTYFIRRQSNFFFNRHTQQVYFRNGKNLYVGEWSRVQAGMVGQTEFSGRSVSTSYYLLVNVFGTEPGGADDRRLAKEWMPMRSIRLDSNEPSDPRRIFVAQVREYLREFMAHGPDRLPLPQEPHWWYVPHNNICLTPAQAWRHYAPWRTGEPGELQGKKWWLLPLWAVLFPYNLFAALSWWVTCRVLRVRPAEPPPEAFEGEADPLVTLDMAARGIRP